MKRYSVKESQVADQERGMTLIETTVALVIIMIALLGVVHTFTYAVTYNYGNAIRTESLALIQKEVETLRAAKWTSSGIDPTGLLDGTGNNCDPVVTIVASPNGGAFRVERIVDDDPSTPTVCEIDPDTQLKDVTVTVRIATDDNPAWWFAVPNTVVLRRTRGN
jgi:type II secretory pathway pseudopilin PulG